MSRGGARKGAGRVSPWNHGETKTIRVPITLADQVLETAKKLDAGYPLKIEPGSRDLDQIATSVFEDPLVTRKGKDSGAVKRALDAFVLRLRAVL
jgi:hypothetical protein